MADPRGSVPASSELHDLVELVAGSGSAASVVRIPSLEAVLSVLQQRHKRDLPWLSCGPSTLLAVNPLKPLPDTNDATAEQHVSAALWRGEPGSGQQTSSSTPPHPYEFAGRVFGSMQRSGKSQAIVVDGLSGSGKSYTSGLVLNQLLRVSQTQANQSASSSASKRVNRLTEQLRAAQVVLDAFGACKTATTPNATRQGRVLELHYSAEDSATSLLAGAKVLTFGFDRARLQAALGKEERSFHVFYQFIAGSSAKEQRQYELLGDPSEYDLLASSGCYRLPAESPNHQTDEMGFDALKAAFDTLGFKQKHTEMIYKILSAVLLLGNIGFTAAADDSANKQESVSVSYETRPVFSAVCTLLGLQEEDLERALVNKTTYVRKEVVCALLDQDGATRQRDSLMGALYAILFSYVVESVNHRLYPGDEPIKKLQRDNGGTSIVLLDIPGFQTKSPNGGLLGGALSHESAGSMRRSTLIQAYGEDGYDQFIVNYANELVEHWITRRAFNDDAFDLVKRCTADGVKLPAIDIVDESAMTLELLRGGLIGSRADSKPGGMLGGLSKTCSNLRKGKLSTEDAADSSFIEGMEERFAAHSRYVPRIAGRTNSFAIKHYAGTVSYSGARFVEKDSDLLDSEFVRLFRSSSSSSRESFLAKLFSGPSLACESHPRDPAVLVAAQVSAQPLRRLSPLKFSRTSSSSVSSDPPEPDIQPVTGQLNETLTLLLASLNEVPVWTIRCIRPNDSALPGVFDIRRVRAQVDAMDLSSLIGRKRVEYSESLDFSEFRKRYASLDLGEGDADDQTITEFMEGRGFVKGRDYAVGTSAVWLSFSAWKSLESVLRTNEHGAMESTKRQAQLADAQRTLEANAGTLEKSGLAPSLTRDTTLTPDLDTEPKTGFYGESSDDLLKNAGGAGGIMPHLPYDPSSAGFGRPQPGFMRQSQMSFSPSLMPGQMGGLRSAPSEIWGQDLKGHSYNEAAGQPGSPGFPTDGYSNAQEKGIRGDKAAAGKETTVQEVPTSRARRAWLALVWTLTWWIPTFMLTYVGRMKRPDVRIAWREKVALCILVFLVCAALLFVILGLGHVLCPQYDKAWNTKELSYHQGTDDYYAAVAGKVYDLTNFYKGQHSDITGEDVTDDDMLELAGQDLTEYFPVPLSLGCPDLMTVTDVYLQYANFSETVPTAVHYSGAQQSVQTSALHNQDWYTATFLPKMEKMYKGPLVFTNKEVQKGADDDGRIWAMYNKRVYDISDYVYTVSTMNDDDTYQFLPTAVTDIFQEQAGQDITSAIDGLDESTLNSTLKSQTFDCLDNVFYRGNFDFRTTPRCTVQSYFLLAFSIVLIATIFAKFVAALQITKKRNPELQDKFVICQVPCYTEGEESLKKTIDSLANLKYDDKRKLLFVICDGMIVGSGNDRPTPRIVLDILGVDNLDPDPLLFKSLGQGNKQLNYGKVYSGLYEFEGHVMPYVVVVKVGKPSERSRPGNRGKRDSQILLMRFLNRVHFDAEMSPLELEIHHQIKNVIGVDPTLYEYLLTVDADTEVMPDSLNRLVATAAEDTSIIGLCGETKLSNEQESWWTMIQVYEYYISHHLAKAFESLFGSVTCLPGCFTMFRLRTADKGRPLLISNLVIDDYSENEVDTLHKKNLLHLGEDRYLTTLILKHFPLFKTKFASDARAETAAPEKWNILLSQRRRWINSTVHNLFELVTLKDLCGFCCFSMRFIVIIDLLGTIMLPATTVYLIYLIYTVATSSGQVPVISLIMLGAVYGLQVIIFLLKRQWQFIGWLVIYILAYPIYSFFLPIYSFWHFDDFSWGNTRIVVGEGKNKKILAGDDDHFDDSMIPMRKFSEYQQQAWDTQTKVNAHSPQPSEAGFSLAPNRKTMGHSPHGSMAPYAMPGGDPYSRPGSRAATVLNYPTGPQPAFSPFNQMPPGAYQSPGGSVAGSEFGVFRPPASQFRQSQMSLGAPFGGGSGQASMLGMPNQPFAMPGSMSARQSSYSLANWAGPGHASSYSLAGQAGMNPFADPQQHVSPNPVDPTNPTDAEIVTALRNYLKTQDLLQVTKRSTREAMAQQFPQADLSGRKAFLNQSIDAVLQGQL